MLYVYSILLMMDCVMESELHKQIYKDCGSKYSIATRILYARVDLDENDGRNFG